MIYTGYKKTIMYCVEKGIISLCIYNVFIIYLFERSSKTNYILSYFEARVCKRGRRIGENTFFRCSTMQCCSFVHASSIYLLYVTSRKVWRKQFTSVSLQTDMPNVFSRFLTEVCKILLECPFKSIRSSTNRICIQ